MISALRLAIGLGALGGFGAWLIWTGWHPALEPLTSVLARFGQPAARPERVRTQDLDARLGAQVRRIGIIERRLQTLQADLRILERRPDDIAASIGACALLGLLAGALTLIPRVAGLPLPIWAAGWVAIGGGLLGAAYPLLEVREKATKRRGAFRHALSAYCVSVDMGLQVGAGPEQSLIAAADGQGWQFTRLRTVLQQSQILNEEPWLALRRLGEEIEVLDLVELAKSIEQVAVRGASVGDTVSGIADSIRRALPREPRPRPLGEQSAWPSRPRCCSWDS